ncbi:MAG: beta-galactosidase [Candidatus Falkowbacteria bacterium]|nr:beta-galactosidase [Candidatus Falkowbacteria bacterium]
MLSRGHIYQPAELSYGVTFSSYQAKSLGLDWQDLFTKILDELKVRKIRLSAYWNEIEPQPGNYHWQELDWEIQEAGKRNAQIILAVGGRLPRWPECHFPGWANDLPKEERQAKTLQYIAETVNHYKGYANIVAWQVENEPFLIKFGECPPLDKDFLDQEIALVRSLDNRRQIVLTDSGELSLWLPAARRADIFGTTMYRDTYSKVLGSYVHYPLTPGFFRFKKNIVSLFAHPQKWMIIELQAEPWGPVQYQDLSPIEREQTMNLQKFKDILEFSRLAGFKEFYLWGVEWWYWEKAQNNNDGLWSEAKILFLNSNN